MEEYVDKYDLADTTIPFGHQLTAHYIKSFAHFTMKDRVPVIITNILDRLAKNKDDLAAKFGEDSKEELKTVIGEISKLKYELQTDKQMLQLRESDSDAESWNNFLQSIAPKDSYFQSVWLYAECYVYRRIKSIFYCTKTMKDYDYFEDSKHIAYFQSLPAISLLLKRIEDFNSSKKTTEELKEVFFKLLKLNLWGNKNDLSITLGQELVVLTSNADPFDEVETYNDQLLANDSEKIWNCIVDPKIEGKGRIDIINDNAGYELLVDFVLADFLIEHNLTPKIQFHVKSIPWFISDVLVTDFHWMLEKLSSSDNEQLQKAGEKWTNYVKDGKFELVEPTSDFWTGPYEFFRMQTVDKKLYDHLAESHLIIFKGDLNYRKLLGDINWRPETDFSTSLKDFRPSNICSLRTIKADVVSGLQNGKAESLAKEDPKWMESGKFGVISFAGIV